MAFWNNRPGLSIDDNDSKDDICVEMDVQPDFAVFYGEISKDTNGDTTLLNRWFEWEDTSDDKVNDTLGNYTLYNIGDIIEIYDNSARKLGFPLPQSDMFGRCDFSSFATFYSEVDVECQYRITSLSECTTILSPSTYSDFSVLIDRNTTELANRTINNSTTTTTAPSAGTDCSGHLTSLKLEFYFNETGEAGFIIESVNMEYETDSSAKSVGDFIELKVITKFYRNTNLTIREISGNPGYLTRERLLLVDDSYQLTGYRKDISDSSGNCLGLNPTLSTITDNYVEFFEDINLQCNVAIASEVDFQDQCTETAYQSYYMFSQFTRFGRYGTADTSDTEDWTDVINQTVSTAPTFSGSTCSNMITTIQYEILWSLQGYEDDLQYYISAINAKPLQEDVTFTTGTTTSIPYRVIMTNYLVLPDDIRDDTTIPYEFPPDLGGKLY